jgi:hypothetical protein
MVDTSLTKIRRKILRVYLLAARLQRENINKNYER